ncbi:Glucan endo-1,3-beta-glucosidase 6 [Linum perenne]
MGLASLFVGLVSLVSLFTVGSGIGANWGTQATHPLDPDIVVRLLKDNGIKKVKLFDADYDTLRALGKSGIEVMVGIPNDMLATMAAKVKNAEEWVSQNVSKHITTDSVNIRYVAVGNEPFLQTYNGSFLRTTFPALRNVQSALIKAGLANQVKVTCPLNADVYESASGLPSGGDFRQDIHGYMLEIVKFLSETGSPFTVNIYPFISLYIDSNFPAEYAFFDGDSSPLNDGGMSYNNMFDANHDTLVHALQKNGFGNMPIIIGEIGWPTDGDRNANVELARRFNQGFMSRISGGRDAKSIDPGNFERHWGIFTFDGQPKYLLNLGTTNTGRLIAAKGLTYQERKWCVMRPSARLDDPQVPLSVSYACSLADCTKLGYGTSCGNLDARGNISYAFNSYFQIQDQKDEACKFPNLSTIVKTDPSQGTCKFDIMVQPYYGGAARLQKQLRFAAVFAFISLLFLWI